MRYAAVLSMLLVSCGSFHYSVDPEVESVLYEVYEECPALPRTTHEIRFSGTTMPGVNAYCQGTQYINGMERKIVIDRMDWNRFTPVQRKLLLLHELVHCELGVIEHSPDKTDIMYYQDVEEELASEVYASRGKYCNK